MDSDSAFDPRVEEVGRGAAADLHVLDDGFGTSDQELFQMADPGVERIGDVERALAETCCRSWPPVRSTVSASFAARVSMVVVMSPIRFSSEFTT